MNRLKIVLVLAICAILLFQSFGCGRQETDIEYDPDGNLRPRDSVTNITFWGWGDAEEVAVFTKIVNAFNEKYKDIIKVNYVQKPSSGYSSSMALTLRGRNTPDVFYVEEKYFKQWANAGFLYDITDFYESSLENEKFSEDDLYPYTVDRYRYNIETTTSNREDNLYALPKSIDPTAIFYNKTHFDNAGVNVISMTEQEITDYNLANPNNKKSIKGYDSQTNTFNNKIAMNWSEIVELSQFLMYEGVTDYGFFTEWWFNYGWSIGGDCIEFIPTDDPLYNGGYYEFTLADCSKNYIVKEDFSGALTVNGNNYYAGEIIKYQDKFDLTNQQKQNCHELPSMREAFTEFVRLPQDPDFVVDNVSGVYNNVSDFYGADSNGDIKGYAIAPNPTTIRSDGKNNYFSSGRVSMILSTHLAVNQFHNNMRDEWDTAPPLVYKEYNHDGTEVLVSGKKASNCGSAAIAISSKSNIPKASYLFLEFVAGYEGQSIVAERGYQVPIQPSLAESDLFIRDNYNVSVFLDGATYQSPADWWYLRDSRWIDDWANHLNGDVRNGVATLTQFYDSWIQPTNALLKDYTKK